MRDGIFILTLLFLFGCFLFFSLIFPPLIISFKLLFLLFDGVAHGGIAFLILLPLFILKRASFSKKALFSLTALAIFLDLDHFVAARSFSLYAATHLPMRPLTHSLSFAIILALVVQALTKNPFLSWGAFATIASHIFRDSLSGAGTPLLYPFPSESLSYLQFYLLEVSLFLTSGALALIK